MRLLTLQGLVPSGHRMGLAFRKVLRIDAFAVLGVRPRFAVPLARTAPCEARTQEHPKQDLRCASHQSDPSRVSLKRTPRSGWSGSAKTAMESLSQVFGVVRIELCSGGIVMRGRDTTVEDLMVTTVITVDAETSIDTAVERMLRSDIRHLPVVDGAGKIVGILSDRDLMSVPKGREMVAVRGLMSDEVLTVQPQVRACEASALMLDLKIGALPVVDESNTLVGILTETDFLRVAHVALGGDDLSTDDD